MLILHRVAHFHLWTKWQDGSVLPLLGAVDFLVEGPIRAHTGGD